jgi:hypothetical protein
MPDYAFGARIRDGAVDCIGSDRAGANQATDSQFRALGRRLAGASFGAAGCEQA